MQRRITAGLMVATLALTVPGLAPASAAPAVSEVLGTLTGEGYQVLCSQAGYGCVAGTGYTGQSRWGANYGAAGHNCTSYVSFRLAQQGVAQPWRPMGDGGRWDDNGAKHVPVDDRPAVGAVAQWDGRSRYAPGPSGHVAFVEVVDGDTIEVTDDSHGGGTRRVRITRGSAYWPSHFVHIHDAVDKPKEVGELVFGGVRSAVNAGTGAFGLFLGTWVLARWELDYVT